MAGSSLKKAELSTLLVAFTEAITQASVTSGKGFRLNREWGATTIEALDESAAKKLNFLLDETGLQGFLRNQVIKSIHLSGEPFPERKTRQIGWKKIKEYDCFANPLESARHLLSVIEKAPNKYIASTRCPFGIQEKMQLEDDEVFQISKSLSIKKGKLLAKEFKLSHESSDYENYLKRTCQIEDDAHYMPEDDYYFVFRWSGLVSDPFDSQIAQDFSDALRAFYGASLALKILEDFSIGEEAGKALLAVNEIAESVPSLALMQNLDTDLRHCAGLDTSLDTDAQIRDGKLFTELLAPVAIMFTCKESRRLITASIWLARAYLSNRPMDKILEAAIAIEVLLGDREASDRVGLSKLIANRCAYSLGKTSKERDEIRKFFTDFYRVRSEIVHSGRFKITSNERIVVNEGLNLASRILEHEIKLSDSGN